MNVLIVISLIVGLLLLPPRIIFICDIIGISAVIFGIVAMFFIWLISRIVEEVRQNKEDRERLF